jgi:hypothetical protein
VIFTLTATNSGPPPRRRGGDGSAPSGFTFVSSPPGQGTYTAASGICRQPAANASATLQITAQVLATEAHQHRDADRLHADRHQRRQ